MKTNKTDLQTTVDSIWLSYFNNYLFETGLISEKERNQISIKIKTCTQKENSLYRY